jgi:hypothetical protein
VEGSGGIRDWHAGERHLEGNNGDGGEPRGSAANGGDGRSMGRRLGGGWVAAGQTLTLAAMSRERGDAGAGEG